MGRRAKLLTGLLALALIATALWLGLLKLAAHDIPAFEQVRSGLQSSETRVLDRHGELLQSLRTDPRVRQLHWVSLEQTSPALIRAVLESEDRRFYQHHGVDWRAIAAAAWSNLRGRSRPRGASTISMQLAGLLDDALHPGSHRRSWKQKFLQLATARQLESEWSKAQILEAWLNMVPMRGELVGVDALAHAVFAKEPHGLNETEAAVTAALVRAPNAAIPQVASRSCALLKALRTKGSYTNCPLLEGYIEDRLAKRRLAPSSGIAAHYARRALKAQTAQNPAQIRTTLDAGLQGFALQSLRQQIRELHGKQVQDGAIIVLDNASGEVLAWVGSSGDLSQAAQVDGVTALRQPGSTLKPLLYGQALAEQRITAASLLHDWPVQLHTASGLYIPHNYDRRFQGWVSVRTALASSLNLPAVRTLVMVSPRAFHSQLARFGIALPENGDYYGYSLALGSAEVSLLQLSNAFRALANGGRWGPVGEPPQQAALDPGAAFIIGDILSDRNARARTFGSDSILATRFWTAAKTGTSKDMRDNWVVGWSQHYTVGVWIGNASGAPMWEVTGISGAGPVWVAIMNYLHRDTSSRPPVPPADLVRLPVHYPDLPEADRLEWFLPGTEQQVFALPNDTPEAPEDGDGNSLFARILTPQDGSIIALDPDIPPANQGLVLSARVSDDNAQHLQWWVDGQLIGRGKHQHWLPLPGRYTIELRDPQNDLLDHRRIEVRGATGAPGTST